MTRGVSIHDRKAGTFGARARLDRDGSWHSQVKLPGRQSAARRGSGAFWSSLSDSEISVLGSCGPEPGGTWTNFRVGG